MYITFPSNTKQTISDIINADGRDVVFYTYSSYACSACSLDPITNTSTDSFCLVCSGLYWIPVYSGHTYKAHVTWKFADYKDWSTGGWVFVGDGIVKVLLSGNIMDVINSTKYVVVDNKQVTIEKITLLGVPEVNRVVLDFKEKEKSNG